MKILILLESPGKIKKISQIFKNMKDGNEYTVDASMGHITRIADIGTYKCGINLTTFEETYEILPEKVEIVNKLKKEVKDADLVYLASDGDREGNVISYQWINFLKIPQKKYKRVIFKEITEKGIKDGLAGIQNDVDRQDVEAGRARAEIDKLLGYRLSPLSARAIGAKSAGRVQSAALRIICEKEKEIQAFTPEAYYELYLPFIKNRKRKTYKATYKGLKTEKKARVFKSKSELQQVITDCAGNDFVVSDITEKIRSLSPKDAFTTSTLQQAASASLGFSPKRTMEITQKLYEIGLITYMRTDSVRLSTEFVADAKTHIESQYGVQYYKGFTSTKTGDQDGHEAIRPTHLNDDLSNLDPSQLKLYNLIFNRTLASLMSNAKIKDTEVIILNRNHKFTISGKAVDFDGFLLVYNDYDEEVIPVLTKNEILNTKALDLVEKQTCPPNRFTEAGIIKTLETTGIGRPSTFAPTIETLKNREYIKVEKKTVFPTELGMKLTDLLVKYFPDIINTKYTSEMESTLDKISSGKADRVEELSKFFEDFNPKVNIANKEIQGDKAQAEKIYAEGEVCPLCGSKVQIRTSRTGTQFKSCSSFPKCKWTASLNVPSVNPNLTDIVCPVCHLGKLVKRQNKKDGSIFYGCTQWSKTKCNCIVSEADFKLKYENNFQSESQDK